MNKKRILIILAAVLAVAAIAAAGGKSKSTTAAAETPAQEAAASAEPSANESVAVTSAPEITPVPAVIDNSAVQAGDVTAADVKETKVNDERHVILTLKGGSTVDAGYIGGLETKGKVVVVFIDADHSILSAQMVDKGGDATPPADPVREGYDFYGWDGTYTGVKSDTAVMATYVKKDLYYTVTFCDAGGNAMLIEKVAAGSAATAPDDPVADGMIFAGWDKDFSAVTQNMTVTATFIKETDPAFVVDKVSAKAGDQGVQVTVKLQNNPGICAANLAVSYDDGLTLTAVEFNTTDLGDNCTGPEKLPAADGVKLLWYQLSDLKTDCVYVTLTFDVAEDAQGMQKVSVSYDPEDVFNISEENIPFGVVNGGVRVTE